MPANEDTPMHPVNPYGAAKLYAHSLGAIYRKMGVWISCGICFNHEHYQHGPQFFPGKMVARAVGILNGKETRVILGDLSRRRDWGWAPEYIPGMVAMLRHSEPDDFVLATGKSCSLGDMAAAIFQEFGLDFYEYYQLSPNPVRPVELDQLEGNAWKASKHLGWSARSDWRQVAKMLAEHYAMAVASLEAHEKGQLENSLSVTLSGSSHAMRYSKVQL